MDEIKYKFNNAIEIDGIDVRERMPHIMRSVADDRAILRDIFSIMEVEADGAAVGLIAFYDKDTRENTACVRLVLFDEKEACKLFTNAVMFQLRTAKEAMQLKALILEGKVASTKHNANAILRSVAIQSGFKLDSIVKFHNRNYKEFRFII